jgi:lipopolysaccharide export system permease protein
MQFFWKYIDDLMGKGLDIWTLTKLIIYVSASLLPLALPLAMLLSSIMTVGNLAENNELTALKSSGLSLTRILKPLITVCLVISLFTFYFSNYVIPIANYKWRALIYDIQETKIAMLLTPGTYSHQIDKYIIKVKETKNNVFKDVTIHDMSVPGTIKTIKAEKGTMYKAAVGNAILLKLENGSAFEENDLKEAINTGRQNGESFPQKRYKFESAIFKIQISGFDMKRSKDEEFQNSYEMYNVFQLSDVVDSVNKNARTFIDRFSKSLITSSLYNQYKMNDSLVGMSTDSSFTPAIILKNKAVLLKNLEKEQLRAGYQSVIDELRAKKEMISGQKNFMDMFIRNLGAFYIEFHRKFALTVSIIVLFFIGAPLGAIVKKGGFGAPVVIAALLFMIYFVLISVGESLASQEIVSPAFGMWISTLIMLPFAFILMYAASNDLPVTSWSSYKRLFKRRRK